MSSLPADRAELVGLFGGYDLPTVNICAVADCVDFVGQAKAAGIPPFALVLHALGRASLEIEHFRLRLEGRTPYLIDRVRPSYTVIDAKGNLNFSMVDWIPDFDGFLAAYLGDREKARRAERLRLTPITDREYLFVTCLPWLRFTSIQHPTARFVDSSIPNVAVGRFEFVPGRVSFPISVQAHHGLVDGLHIARYVARVEAILDEATERLRSSVAVSC